MISLDKLFTWLTSLGFFLLVSTPSIKVLYSNPIINLIPLSLFVLVFACVSVKPIPIGGTGKLAIRLLFVFAALFYLYFAFAPYSFQDYDNFLRYAFFFLALFLVVALHKWLSIKIVLNLVILWAVIIALLRLTGNLSLDASKGQTYLTVGLPMGAGLTTLLVSLVQLKNKNLWVWFFHVLGISFIITTLLLSRGRSNLLFPLVILLLFLFATMLLNRKFRRRSIWLSIILAGIGIIVYSEISGNEEYKAFERINSSIDNADEESRLNIWIPVANLILTNPFGYGVDSYEYLLWNYPHNIFLEVTLSLGIFGLAALLGILTLFLKSVKNELVNYKDNKLLIFAFTAGYFFLSWNTSFDFATAYVPLGMILISYLKISNQNKAF